MLRQFLRHQRGSQFGQLGLSEALRPLCKGGTFSYKWAAWPTEGSHSGIISDSGPR